MAQTPLIIDWHDTSGSHHSESLVVHGDPTADPDAPVVILLHGTNGTIDDMSNPSNHPGWAYDHATPLPDPMPRGTHSYPGIGVWGWEIDNPLSTRVGWQPFLDGQGFLTLNYAQVEPAGSLASPSATQTANPVSELDAVVRAAIAAFPGRRIAFVTHSRGGILLRTWLVAHRGDAAIRPYLSRAVMLAAPNQGSDIANIAVAIDRQVTVLESLVGEPAPLEWLRQQVNSPAYVDYEVGSGFLAGLAAAEPVAGIAIDTFGGTSPDLTRLHEWAFTLGSALPSFHVDGFSLSVSFDWATADDPILGIRTLANDVSAGIDELSAGRGDVLVADARARLPFATHHTHAVNHAEALWDTGVLQDGIGVLRQARGAPSVNVDDAWLTLSNVPARVDPSRAFDVSVTVANTGTTDLAVACRLIADDGAGHAIWGAPPIPLPAPLARGHSAQLQWSLVAPTATGSHGLRVELQGANGAVVGRGATASIRVATQAAVCQQLAQQLAQEQATYEEASSEAKLKTSAGKPADPGAAGRASAAQSAMQRIRQQQAENGCH